MKKVCLIMTLLALSFSVFAQETTIIKNEEIITNKNVHFYAIRTLNMYDYNNPKEDEVLKKEHPQAYNAIILVRFKKYEKMINEYFVLKNRYSYKSDKLNELTIQMIEKDLKNLSKNLEDTDSDKIHESLLSYHNFFLNLRKDHIKKYKYTY